MDFEARCPKTALLQVRGVRPIFGLLPNQRKRKECELRLRTRTRHVPRKYEEGSKGGYLAMTGIIKGVKIVERAS
jgi:hypothetical protein